MAEFCDNRRQNAHDKRFAGSDAELTGNSIRLFQDVLSPADGTEDFQRTRQKPFPRLGKLYLFADAFKELSMQLFFQLFDLHGNGGLGVPQLLGRF